MYLTANLKTSNYVNVFWLWSCNASTVVTYLTASYAYTTAIIAVAAVGVALAQPYKKPIYNIIDACLLIIAALLYVTLVPLLLLQPARKEGDLSLINAVLVAFLVLYIPAVSISWLVSLKSIFRWYKKLQLKRHFGEVILRQIGGKSRLRSTTPSVLRWKL